MRPKTLAVHAGYQPEAPFGAIMPPVYQTSTFAYESPDKPYVFDYSRSGNPTRQYLENALAQLEHGCKAFAFASGLAAETAVVFLCNAGDHILACEDLYGGTFRLLKQVAEQKGIVVTFVDMTDLDAVRRAFKSNTKLVWLESPSNPLMKVLDLQAIAEYAREHGALSVCDNTFLSPYFQNPLDWGIDIVVHSTTKYLNGHSDVVGGAVIVRDDTLAEKIYFLQNAMGAVPGPWDCFLVLRGLRTLPVRMEAHHANALKLAEWLRTHPAVEAVLHPCLSDEDTRVRFARYARGAGGTFSFRIRGGAEAARRVLSRLRLFTQAVSLGGVESLVAYPWNMTHAAVPPEVKNNVGITENLLRLSVGLEDWEDLRDDLEQALSP